MKLLSWLDPPVPFYNIPWLTRLRVALSSNAWLRTWLRRHSDPECEEFFVSLSDEDIDIVRAGLCNREEPEQTAERIGLARVRASLKESA